MGNVVKHQTTQGKEVADILPITTFLSQFHELPAKAIKEAEFLEYK